jgi:large subunit ribosomal protein L21
MYAIIQDGGHQYRVEQGQRIRVQLREVEQGATISFDNVCMVGGSDQPRIGKPFVAGASVQATVTQPTFKAKKVITLKYRRRKNSQRQSGHRQRYTEVQIIEIRG